jgi:hypothetical protein
MPLSLVGLPRTVAWATASPSRCSEALSMRRRVVAGLPAESGCGFLFGELSGLGDEIEDDRDRQRREQPCSQEDPDV